MRAKKSREVNIFSASVVDLFASGLGVFLIVSILALVNQKKETSRALEGGKEGTIIKTPQEEKGVGEQQNYAQADDPLVSELKKMVEKLEVRLEKKNREAAELKQALLLEKTKEEPKVDQENKFELEIAKRKNRELERKLEKVEAESAKELKDFEKKVVQLQQALANQSKAAKSGEKGVAESFSDFQIGSRIKLQNVHFYPGTEKAIEPYSSREVSDLANFLRQNPIVTIEISGHIYETKKAIESGKADDEYNLSGRRANYVCEKLEEFGISRKRLRCVGYGATRPLYLTDDQYSEEAQLNRRVEVEILTK